LQVDVHTRTDKNGKTIENQWVVSLMKVSAADDGYFRAGVSLWK
jgi:hypothetical protein